MTRDLPRDAGRPDNLDLPLPGERLRGLKPRFYEYQRFPAFSRHWLIGRTLIFMLVISGFTLMVGLGNLMLIEEVLPAVQIAGLFFLGFMSFSTLGPLFATLVRYRRWPLAMERIGVVAALVLGIVASGFTDHLVSGDMKRRLEQKIEQSGLVDKAQIEAARKRERSATGMAVGLISGVVIYGLLGGGLGLIAYWREPARLRAIRDAEALREMRSAKAESDLRLGALQAQVEPHFLFNTLAAVRASLRTNPADAEAMLDALIDYLRATIPKLRAGSTGVDTTLGAQLELAGHYLRLMRLRMGDRLTVEIECPEPLRAQPFPPLLLLSLVENAIKHGVEPKPGPVRVRVEAGAEGNRLVVRVSDDGVGLAASAAGGGVGLANIREHLRTRHGQEASLDLQSRAGGGTVATMTLPISTP